MHHIPIAPASVRGGPGRQARGSRADSYQRRQLLRDSQGHAVASRLPTSNNRTVLGKTSTVVSDSQISPCPCNMGTSLVSHLERAVNMGQVGYLMCLIHSE